MAINPHAKTRLRYVNGVHYFDHPSMTDQSFKKDCDINLVVKRFLKSQGMNNSQFLNYMATLSPHFDSTQAIVGYAPDYQDHLQSQIDAKEMFLSLPSAMRKRFNNNPGQFLNFVFDPSNRAELATMGLLKPEVAQSIKDAALAKSEALKADLIPKS